MAGTLGAAAMSDANARSPRTALSPPVSTSAFHAPGFSTGLLLGAAASTTLCTTNPTRSPSRQPRSASSSSDCASAPPAR